MAYSYFDYKGTGKTIQTDISCVSTEHMYAFEVLSEDDSNVTLGNVALPATFTKNNTGVLCELKTAPSTKIRVIRSTPYDVLMHDFSNGAQFNADSVDEVYEQLLYLCQEIVEGKLIIDNSGNFGDASAGSVSQSKLQAELAAKYSLGYSDGTAAGTAAGDAAGYSRGYSSGYSRGYSEGDAACKAAGTAAGEAAGYSRGYSEGEAAGKAVGYSDGMAAGYSEGEAAGKAEGSGGGSGGGQMTNGTIRDEAGRTIYPVVVTFTERHKDGNQIVSNGVVFSYSKNISVTNNISNNGKSKVFVDLGTKIVGGGVEYTYKSAEATFVSASINTST